MLTCVYPETLSPDEYAINLLITTENTSLEIQHIHIIFNLIFKGFLWEKIIFSPIRCIIGNTTVCSQLTTSSDLF